MQRLTQLCLSILQEINVRQSRESQSYMLSFQFYRRLTGVRPRQVHLADLPFQFYRRLTSYMLNLPRNRTHQCFQFYRRLTFETPDGDIYNLTHFQFYRRLTLSVKLLYLQRKMNFQFYRRLTPPQQAMSKLDQFVFQFYRRLTAGITGNKLIVKLSSFNSIGD